MRTTDKKAIPALLMALALFIPCFSAPGRAEPVPAGKHRLFVGVVAGYFYPVQNAFRELYAKPAWPFEFQLGWEWSPRLSLFGAARYHRASGKTIPLPAVHAAETYVLRLEVLALRLGLNYWLGRGRIAPFLGAGIQHAFFRETWRDLPIEAQRQKMGFFAQAGGRWRLARSLVALLQMEYSRLPGGEGYGAEEKIELGGLGLSLGIRAGIL